VVSTDPDTRPAGGVQSIQRALDILEIVAESGGSASIAHIASAAGLPTPTAHRILRTLADRGYIRQHPDRRYGLGFRLVPLGAAANTVAGVNATAVLSDLVAELGETANLAVLSGQQAEYVAQVPARYSMRMFTEVGRRVQLHCTGVGKVLLAQLDEPAVRGVVRAQGLARHTEHTITSEAGLLAALAEIRRDGFAVDEQEQEIGVRCVAVPVTVGGVAAMAVSVSGPVTRMTPDRVAAAVPLLQTAARRLAADITGG
jgi:IclR family transcriptional regulator, acetate operon repressor